MSVRLDAARPALSGKRRLAWSLADQGVASISNVLLSLVLLRLLDPRSFGGFAVAFTVYLVALNVIRAFCCEPYVMSCAGEATPSRLATARSVLGVAFLLGCGCSAVGLLTCLLVPTAIGHALLPIALAFPLMALQDVLRYVAFAAAADDTATRSDVLWLALQLILTVPVFALGLDPATFIVGAWAVGGALAGVYYLARMGLRPDVGTAPRWIRANLPISGRLVVEYACAGGAVQLSLLAITAVGGLRWPGEFGRCRFWPVRSTSYCRASTASSYLRR